VRTLKIVRQEGEKAAPKKAVAVENFNFHLN
jgi:hypothetical protein